MGARILVADDSVTIQKVVELTFSREDFVLIPARSGEEAIRKAKEARPDLMLIDLVMPDKNGYDVCRALREDPQLKTTPIILLAGTFESFDKDEGLRVGANDFVTKPFESRTLITKVKQLLSPAAAPAAREPVPPRPAAPAVLAEGVAAEERMPAMAAPPASPLATPAAAALSPAQGPVFEPHEELFPEVPSAPPRPPPDAPPVLSAAPPEPAPGRAPSELQELSLDDLTAEEPLGGLELPPVEQQRVEPAAAPGLAEARGRAGEPPSRQMAPAPAAPAFDLELGSSYPEAGPSMAEALPAAPALPELDLDLVSARAPAAPVYELEPLDLEAPPPSPPPPSVVGTEDLLRELESAGALRAAEPAKPLAAPAAAPAAPRERETPPTVVSSAVEPGMPRPPEPMAATAPSADALAARLAAELGPHLAREIADRIVERIERVVWEVVPDLAEALIARELDRIKERAERRPAR